MKISEAYYINGNNPPIKKNASDITKRDYLTIYRGHLYCTVPECKALLSFIERKKNAMKYFRTWSKSKHKDGCPNEVTYNDEHFRTISNGNKKLINLSDRHILDKLKRAYESTLIPRPGAISGSKGIKNSKNKGKKEDTDIHAALFDEGNDSASEKQPYILTIKFDKLDSTDFGEVRCVIGYIQSIYLFDTHGYINLAKKGPNSVKVFFSRAFVNDEKNSTQYRSFNVLRDYYYKNRSKENPILCCCVGRIEPAKNGINVCPDRYNGFTINGLGYYDIIRQQHNIL